MQNGKNKLEQERRKGLDRRTSDAGLDFPFIDSHGHLVTHERRRMERRNSNSRSRQQTNPGKAKSYA